MRKDADISEEIKDELEKANKSLTYVRGNMAALHERVDVLESRTIHALRPLGTISANSSLIAICAVISTVALCKMAWW